MTIAGKREADISTNSAACDVIIPVKNAGWWVAPCLEELFRNTAAEILGKILLVDDGSTPESQTALGEIVRRFPRAELLKNEGEPGFGGTCNFGAARCSSPYLLLLNTDCFVTPRAIEKMIAACKSDSKIGLACPMSNNSPPVTVPLMPGRSFIDMNALFEAAGAPLDVCTVVGNCLMITRKCWEDCGPFDKIWGTGYGEESDLHMKAAAKGYRGVAAVNTYVFHFGGGSFRFVAGADQLRARNHELFIKKWGDAYHQLLRKHKSNDPVARAAEVLKPKTNATIQLDVLFVIPGISQEVGGIHIVFELCNALIRSGVSAGCAVLGPLSREALEKYQEPVLFGLLQFESVDDFSADKQIEVKTVVATLHSTALPSYIFARAKNARLTSFVQGNEFLFQNGRAYSSADCAYRLADDFLTTSHWLENQIRSHVSDRPIARIPLGVDRSLFHPSQQPRETMLRVAMVLRTSPDKGQGLLLEVAHSVLRDLKITLLILRNADLELPYAWTANEKVEVVDLPLSRAQLAAHYRRCNVLIDASLHEGFGLIPLEALASGCTVIVSDSGGVNDFIKHGVNGFLIKEVNKPEVYVEALAELVKDEKRLRQMQHAAAETATEFSSARCWERSVEHFRNLKAVPIEFSAKELESRGIAPEVVQFIAEELGVASKAARRASAPFNLKPEYKHSRLYPVYRSVRDMLPRRVRNALYQLVVNPDADQK